eukprot:TRINITY_DN4898_c0_g2_i1.p1 TRINITY_DN4898_c0_g2~~TRINITY_DN4898_c0_g2_i1.p1  ORF type:complete len:260 (+),score=28.90 TRINITY_DN4898_c0_g2_i1:176-955(+)
MQTQSIHNISAPFSFTTFHSSQDICSSLNPFDFCTEHPSNSLKFIPNETSGRLGETAVNLDMSRAAKRKAIKPSKKIKYTHYGRWTTEEHDRVMKALDLYGNEWSEVERYVGTRTSHQIRSHLQKHFLKQRKNQIMELARSGQLRSQIFVVTREYRNNLMARKNSAAKHDSLPDSSAPSAELPRKFDRTLELDEPLLNLSRVNENEDLGYDNMLSNFRRSEMLEYNFDFLEFGERDEPGKDFGFSDLRERGEEDNVWLE